MEAAKVCSGGSTVPAAVVIVVKHRACLSVGRLIVGVQAQSFVVLAGPAALSVCRWYMAVRCQRRVGSVGRSARSLVTGLVRRHIGARSCCDNILDRDLERQ